MFNKFILTILIVFFVPALAGAVTIDAGDVNVSGEVPATPLNITDITISDISSSSAIIAWNTNKSAVCTLYYGEALPYAFSVAESDYFQSHLVNLKNLKASTLYHFMIKCRDKSAGEAAAPDLTFETLAAPAPTPSPSPTVPTPPYEAPAGQVFSFPSWIDIFTSWTLSKILYALFAILALVMFIFSLLGPFMAGLPLLSFWDWFLALFIYLYKKKWGIVYDAESKKPVPKAKVMLYDFESKKMLESCFTNNLGEYGFEIKKGKYYLVVEKTDYEFTSKIIKKDYHKEMIEIKEKSAPVINIPIDVDGAVMEYRFSLLSKINKFFNAIRYPLLAAGTIVSVIFYLKWPIVFNLLVVLLYIVTWVWELISFSKIQTKVSKQSFTNPKS